MGRFQTAEGNATYPRPYEDTGILCNMSAWETVEDLKNFFYAPKHLELLRPKANWFAKLDEAHLALWWIENGRTPSVEDALAKLGFIQENDPSPDAFTFAKSYSMPNPPLKRDAPSACPEHYADHPESQVNRNDLISIAGTVLL